MSTNYEGDPTLAANMATAPTTNHNLYIYTPSQTLALLFMFLYLPLIPLHIYLSLILPHRNQKRSTAATTIASSKTKNPYFTIPLFIAALLSTTGYILRLISIKPTNQSNLTLYALTNGLIIISPLFICFTLYLQLTSLIRRCLPSRALGVKVKTQTFLFFMTPKILGGMFVVSDVLSFLIQGGGFVIAANAMAKQQGVTKQNTGTNILLFGLVLQVLTFGVFMVVLVQFWIRARANVHFASVVGSWGVVVAGMAIAGLFIMVRSIFRIVEFGQGINGYPLQHEWTLYVFDSVPVWISLVALAYFHPVRWLSGVSGQYNLVENEGMVEYAVEPGCRSSRG